MFGERPVPTVAVSAEEIVVGIEGAAALTVNVETDTEAGDVFAKVRKTPDEARQA